MNTNAGNNVSSSAATSGRPPTSESAYLQKQADEAQAAIKKALEDLKSSLAQGVDVRLWAKEHPWGLAALATAAGFAIAGAAIPSKRQQELKRWIAIERAAAAVRGNGDGNGESNKRPPSPPQPSFLASIGKEAMNVLRPALVGMLTSAVAQYAQPDDQEDHDAGPPRESY